MVKIKIDAISERNCTEGFFNTYMDHIGDQESPSDFHLWVAISLVATALGRDTYVDRGHWKTYPNLYVILVGASALTHKSTAIRIGTKLLRPALGDDFHPFSQKLTPEYFIHRLAKYYEETKKCEAFIEASELANLLGKTQLDDSILKVLTDLWDSPDQWEYGTIGRGEDTCYNLCVNILAGSTADWLKTSLPEESMTAGFFSRLVLVPRPPSGLKFPHLQVKESTEQRERKEWLKRDLENIGLLEGEFIWNLKASQMFEDWYCDHNNPEDAVKQLQGYYGRKGDFLIKLSMIHSANRSNSLRIDEEDFMFALRVLNTNEAYLQGIVDFMGTTEEGKKRNLVLDLLKKHGDWITKTKIAQSTSHKYNAEERRMILESLVEEDKVIIKTTDKGGFLYKYNEGE